MTNANIIFVGDIVEENGNDYQEVQNMDYYTGYPSGRLVHVYFRWSIEEIR